MPKRSSERKKRKKIKKLKRPKAPAIWIEGEKRDEETGKMISFRYKLKVCL